MRFTKLLKKTTACLLATLMVIGSVAMLNMTAFAADDSIMAGASESTAIGVGDNVTIKLGAKDYNGNEINSMYAYLVYTVKSILGDKATIETSYYVSSVSYLLKLDMNINDIELKTYAEERDSDEDIVYVIGKGSDVLIKSGAIEQDEDMKEVKGFWRIFSYTVEDIDENDVAKISCRLTASYLERMGITEDMIANMFNIDSDNEWYKNIYPIVMSLGWTVTKYIKLDDLVLQGNGVPNKAEIGVYKTAERLTVEASTYLAKSGEKTERITIPTGTEVVIADYSNGYATVYLLLNGKYYKTTKVTINSCDLVSKERALFCDNGLKEKSFVKVTELYGTDTDSFEGYKDFWFTSVKDYKDYPLIYDVLYEIKYAYGDAAYIVPASPIVVNGTDVTEEYCLAIPPKYLKSAAGTYRTTTKVSVLNVDRNTEIGSFAANTVFYSTGEVIDGYLRVRYNGLNGVVDASKLEYVSKNVINYTSYKLGDVVYIKKNITEDYDGNEIFADRESKNYFGIDYATDLYETQFEVVFVANDWVELEETAQSVEEHNRDTENYEFSVILPITSISKRYNDSDTDEFSDVVTMYGDATLDKEVNLEDVTTIQKHVASLTKLTGVALNNSDVTGDKKVNMEDITSIQKYVAKLITKFPAEEKKAN
ncbi:MAG: dockerin type I repeat-containing protein [Clostridiales bacterium]|nr:dockerin type I repeat-containing protein [Clostridiales bacterium]